MNTSCADLSCHVQNALVFLNLHSFGLLIAVALAVFAAWVLADIELN